MEKARAKRRPPSIARSSSNAESSGAGWPSVTLGHSAAGFRKLTMPLSARSGANALHTVVANAVVEIDGLGGPRACKDWTLEESGARRSRKGLLVRP